MGNCLSVDLGATGASLVIGAEARRDDLAAQRAQRTHDGLEAVRRQGTDNCPARPGVVGARSRGAGGAHHRLVARIEVQEGRALVERGVEGGGEGCWSPPSRASRAARAWPASRAMPARTARIARAVAQAAVDRVRRLGGIGAPGQVERGQERGVQALHARARAREVHEHEALVGLGVAVLRAGGDAEVLDLDREHHLGQLVGRQRVAVQRAQGADRRGHDRARSAEADLARDGRRPPHGARAAPEARDGRVDERARRVAASRALRSRPRRARRARARRPPAPPRRSRRTGCPPARRGRARYRWPSSSVAARARRARAELGVAQRVLDERRAVAGDGADVEALLAGRQAHGDDAVERVERVGELHLAARVGRDGRAARRAARASPRSARRPPAGSGPSRATASRRRRATANGSPSPAGATIP